MVTFRASIYVITWPTTWLVMCTSSLERKTKRKLLFRTLSEGLTKVTILVFYKFWCLKSQEIY